MAPSASTVCATDSRAVADAYEQRYGRRVVAVPYGAELPEPRDAGRLRELGLERGRYVLFVGRLVPENNAHLLIEAHRRIDTDWPLVVVGDAPYSEGYIAELTRLAAPDVRFPGYVFGDGYAELVRNAGVMAAPTEVGGTHPVIVEALAGGAPLIVSDHPPNLEVVGDAAATFALADGAEGLAAALRRLIDDPDERARLGAAGAERAAERYSWDACAEAYLALCRAARERAGYPAEPPS
jgi:glycosyltransferase involved in cell wall biosynthesis